MDISGTIFAACVRRLPVLFLSIFSGHALAATSIACGSLVSGSIVTASQVDQYAYAGEAGGIITLTLSDTGGFAFGVAAGATLYDPSGKVVQSFVANSQQQVTLALTGTYLLQVYSSNLVTGGTYNLGVECRSPLQPSTPLSCGGITNGNLTAAAQVDQYTYAGQAGGIITLTLSDTGGFAFGVAAGATLYDPSGKVVQSFVANSQQQVTLALTGTYLLQVYSSNLVTGGTYNLGVECRSPLQLSTPLSCGAIANGNLTAAAQVDQYTYAGQAGGIITLTLADTGGFAFGVAAGATLYDPSGKAVQSFVANSQQQVTLTLTGTYLLQVYSSNLVTGGTYNLGMECRSPLQPSTPLSCGGIAHGSLTAAAQVDQYAYAGQAGGIVTLTLSDTGGFAFGVAAGATLYDPSGQAVLSFVANNQQQVTLAWTGTYLFQVYSSNLVTTGSYSLGVNCITPSGQVFVPVTPCRVVDTRNADGPFGGPVLTGGSSRSFVVPNSPCGIPSTAAAYSLNVTVVPTGQLGYLTIWPTGQYQPLVSTLNSDGRIKANAAIVPAGTNGAVSIYVTDPTQVILDIDGYFVSAGSSSSALKFYPLTPCRVVDTRVPTSALGGPYVSGGASRAFPVLSSSCSIPSTAGAYSLNFTAVPHAALEYLTVWPTGQAQPLVSTLNAMTGAITANAAIVPAGLGGEISVYASNDTDLVIDVNGYFAPSASGGLSLYPVTPCRVLDTRTTTGAFQGPLTANIIEVGCSAAPTAAQGFVLNGTVVPSGSLGYLTLWPNGAPQPYVSTLNAVDSAITSNMAIVPTTNGMINAFAFNPTQLILDISGFFAP